MHSSDSLDGAARRDTLRAYLELLRPANIVTAVADIIAGFAAATAVAASLDVGFVIPLDRLGWLIVATCCLYGGGVVFNDVFDINIDAIERPRRPLPSGRASLSVAIMLAAGLLLAGVVAAWQVSLLSAAIAICIAICALIYDGYSKHFVLLGPLSMGLCRGGNLLLGLSATGVLLELWFIAFIPIIHIAAVTLISRGEVYGSQRKPIELALILALVVMLALLSLELLLPVYKIVAALPFVALFGVWFIPALLQARRKPEAIPIQYAVKRGVLALICIDAALAAGFSGMVDGLLVTLLLPLSIKLARSYSVT